MYLWDNHEKYEVECCSKHHHEHMKCMWCWDILSFDSAKICEQIFSRAKTLWFHISEHSVNIMGTCKSCNT
jgi:Fe2+ or Zn2+ uptake regulation protein